MNVETKRHLHVLSPLWLGGHNPVHSEDGVAGQKYHHCLPTLHQKLLDIAEDRGQVSDPMETVEGKYFIETFWEHLPHLSRLLNVQDAVLQVFPTMMDLCVGDHLWGAVSALEE